MDIQLRTQDSIKKGSRCGQSKHHKYWSYLKVLDEKPEILEFIRNSIAASTTTPDKEIMIRAVDIAPEMGPYFAELGETAIHWGLKFALFHHEIFVTTTTDREINPKTGKGYLLLRMRYAKEGDELSPELRKYLEPPTEAPVDQTVEHCFVRS